MEECKSIKSGENKHNESLENHDDVEIETVNSATTT